MSTINVLIKKCEVIKHPNADRLQICQFDGEFGYQCITGLNDFKSGDLCIYIPPDSVLTEKMAESLVKNKIKLESNRRLRAVKIRGILSEGLCLKPSEWLEEKYIKEGMDVTDILGIVKYDPPENQSSRRTAFSGKGINHHFTNSRFKKYTDIENFKKYPRVFESFGDIVVTKKMHGINARYSMVYSDKISLTLWERIKTKFGWKKEFLPEFLVGSHNIIRKPKTNNFERDVYWKVAEKYQFESICRFLSIDNTYSEENENFENGDEIIFFGEIIGPGIQVGYDYGIEEGNQEVRVFDIMVNGRYLDWDDVVNICNIYNLPVVEEIYRGPWDPKVLELAKATDEYNGKKFIREGIVIHTLEERKQNGSRVILKLLNEDYLLCKTNSDNH